MSRPSESDRQFPACRAFVVQLGAASDVARGQFAGRVEHVVSGAVTHFHGFEELMAFIGRVLTRPDTAAPGAGRERGTR